MFFPVSNPCGICPALITQNNIYVKKITFVTAAVDSCNTTCFVKEKRHIFFIIIKNNARGSFCVSQNVAPQP